VKRSESLIEERNIFEVHAKKTVGVRVEAAVVGGGKAFPD
jgi:hypothetical protein